MRSLSAVIALVLAASTARADAPLIVLDQTRLPFDLGPGHPSNNPASPANSPNAAGNSSGNPANAGSTWQNRPSNPDNEGRLIITADGGVLGYYAPNAGGVLNLFDVTGRRIAYRLAGELAGLEPHGAGAKVAVVQGGHGLGEAEVLVDVDVEAVVRCEAQKDPSPSKVVGDHRCRRSSVLVQRPMIITKIAPPCRWGDCPGGCVSTAASPN